MWYREKGFGKHDWLYCMLLNFGGNVGLHGRMEQLVNGYYNACAHINGKTLRGVGATPEGIENNPMMFELLYELPWREERFSPDIWLQGYLKARYGDDLSPEVTEACVRWSILFIMLRRIIREKVQSNLCYVPVRDFIWTEHQPGDMPSYSIHLTQQRKQLSYYFLSQIGIKEIITLNMIWWTSYVRVWQIRRMYCLKKSPKVMTGKTRIASESRHNNF